MSQKLSNEVIMKIYQNIEQKYNFISACSEYRDLIDEKCDCGNLANYIISYKYDGGCVDCEPYILSDEAFLCKLDYRYFLMNYESKSLIDQRTGKFIADYFNTENYE